MNSVHAYRFPARLVIIGLVSSLSLLGTAQDKKPKGEKYALLVGVREYDPNELRTLPYSEADVEELAAVLKSSGYRPENVVLMTQKEATKRARFLPVKTNIEKELRGILKNREADDTVLIALAGHGVQFKENEENYFCPADAKLRDQTTLVPLGKLYEDLGKCAAGLKFIMVDACRNNPQSDNSRARAEVELESVTRPFRKPPPGGVVAFFSCSAGEKAFEHERLKHGIFFHFVIQGLKGGDNGIRTIDEKTGRVELDDFVRFVRKRVPDFVRSEYGADVDQRPELVSKISGQVALLTVDRESLDRAKPASTPMDPADWQQAEGVYLRNVRQLTFDFVRAGEGYFSPDGKTIIFQAEEKGDNPFYQIFTMDLETGKYRRVSPGIGKTTCAYFHPNGKKIIFASSHLDPHVKEHNAAEFKRRADDAKAGVRRRYQWDFDEYMDIFEAAPDGSGLRQLTNTKGYDAEGSYSSDGKQIVFCSKRDGDLQLYIMDSDGTNVRKLTDAPGCYNGGPFLSPDGKRVIFRADRKKKDELQIFVINADGTGERQLTDINGVCWAPYWHKDGKHVIYTAADHSNPNARPNYDLWFMNVDTSTKTRITQAPGQDVLPVFSPDGKKLMWTSTRDGRMSGAQLFIADVILP